jgi:hypothetical protein
VEGLKHREEVWGRASCISQERGCGMSVHWVCASISYREEVHIGSTCGSRQLLRASTPQKVSFASGFCIWVKREARRSSLLYARGV